MQTYSAICNFFYESVDPAGESDATEHAIGATESES